MLVQTPVDRLYSEHNELIEFLGKSQEISFLSTTEENFRKSILLASASFFEKEVSQIILDFCNTCSGKNLLLLSFVSKKAISRQYHTYFSWKETNANSFFGLFGNDFRGTVKQQVKEDPKLDKAIKAFLEIGRERNRLVHQDYANFSLEKTAEEIYDLYKEALFFLEYLKERLCSQKEYSDSLDS